MRNHLGIIACSSGECTQAREGLSRRQVLSCGEMSWCHGSIQIHCQASYPRGHGREWPNANAQINLKHIVGSEGNKIGQVSTSGIECKHDHTAWIWFAWCSYIGLATQFTGPMQNENAGLLVQKKVPLKVLRYQGFPFICVWLFWCTCSVVPSTSHTKHKFKDKIIKNFKTVAGEH